MKQVLLAAAATLAFAGVAHAQIPVTDAGLIGEQTRSNIMTGLSWIKQAEEMLQQYKMLEQQYAAIAHLPQNIMGMASSLTQVPTLQNPLPQVSALPGILNGSRLGPVSGLANGFLQDNRYAAPTGSDFTANEMNARAQGLAGIQALAASGMQSIEQRIASLKDFFSGIQGSPDIQQSAAIQARLQLEQNFVASQQAQAQQLAVLAQAQQQVSEQRVVEKQRSDAEQLEQATNGVPLP